jgi:hypothetical protein
MILLRGCLKFRIHRPMKITKYGLLVRMVCEAKPRYTRGENNGNTKKLRNRICAGNTERISIGNTECSFVYPL